MCGIWGVLGNLSGFDPETLVAAFEKVRPRGPDASRLLREPGMWLGFHRLAINDLTDHGMQPFASCESASYCVCKGQSPCESKSASYCVCNGEIYEYRKIVEEVGLDPELKHGSDCSVLLPLYQKLGGDLQAFIDLIRSSEYALAIVEEGGRAVTLATDPLSVRPLFYFVDGPVLGFSSVLAGLAPLRRSGVRRLGQGEAVRFVRGADGSWVEEARLVASRLAAAHAPAFYETETKELHEHIVKTLTDCVERRLLSDVPIGCLLSGGLDSSLVAAIAAKLLRERGQRLRTFSIGMKDGTDNYYAQLVADHIGSDHTVVEFTPEQGLAAIDDVLNTTETWDITTNRASVGQYLIAKHIRDNTDIKVVLNGDGADECQAGYLYFYLAPDAQAAHDDSMRLVDEIHLFDGLRVDRNISHHGLEARVPFLDVAFVDLYRRIAPALKQPRAERMEKHLIRAAFQDSGLLPEAVLWRKKEAFSDGVSSAEDSWHRRVQRYMEERQRIPPGVGETREAAYYRRRFEELFGAGNAGVIPHYWLPRWTDVSDPSARELKLPPSN